MAAKLPKILSINLFNNHESVQLNPTKPPQPLSQTAAKCYNLLASIGLSRTDRDRRAAYNSALPVLRFLGKPAHHCAGVRIFWPSTPMATTSALSVTVPVFSEL